MIALRGVSKYFAGRPALSQVDLTIPEGCLYGLIGPGAAGKSVLLKLISGLLRADAGEIWVHGRNIAALAESELAGHRREVGMQFQNNALFDHMTVAENVAFPLRRLFHLSEDAVAERVAERLQRVALSGFQPRSPADLSGGQKKRVGIARATITEASIVLYDEPAAGLDPVTSLRIFELLRAEQRARGSTVIMVSSDVDRLLAVSDRVGLLHDGRLHFDGSSDEARASREPLVRQFLLGLLEGPL